MEEGADQGGMGEEGETQLEAWAAPLHDTTGELLQLKIYSRNLLVTLRSRQNRRLFCIFQFYNKLLFMVDFCINTVHTQFYFNDLKVLIQ